MENIRNFFDETSKKLDDIDSLNYHSKRNKYRMLGSIGDRTILLYRDKIADKLFSINKEDRETYAGLIIQEIDDHNFSKYLVQKEEKIDDNNSYKLFSIKNEYGKDEFVDVSPIIDDCDFFITLVSELFSSFKINLQDIADRSDSDSDYRSDKTTSFSELLTCEDEIKPALIEFLKQTFGGKSGKGRLFAIMACALEKTELINYTNYTKLYTSITECFGDIGGLRGFQKYFTSELTPIMKKTNYTNILKHSEIDEFTNRIEKKISELKSSQ